MIVVNMNHQVHNPSSNWNSSKDKMGLSIGNKTDQDI